MTTSSLCAEVSASAICTESWRSAPPGVIFTGIERVAASRRAAASLPAGTAMTTSSIALTCAIDSSDHESMVRPASFTKALGSLRPSRLPLPAATMIAEAFIWSVGEGVFDECRHRVNDLYIDVPRLAVLLLVGPSSPGNKQMI